MFSLPVRLPKNTWLLNCCVSPQSEIIRIDRSLIGAPSNFQHIGHLGAGDLPASSAADDNNALGRLLASKGSPDFAMAVPAGLRMADIPVRTSTSPMIDGCGDKEKAEEKAEAAAKAKMAIEERGKNQLTD